MILLRRMRSGQRSGVVLLWSTFASMVVFAAAFVLSTLASSSKRVADMNFHRTGAEHLSVGAVAVATEVLRQALEGGVLPPAAGTATLGGTEVGYTIHRIDIHRVGGSEQAQSQSRLVSTYRVAGMAEQGGVTAESRQIVQGIVTPVRVEVQNVVTW